MRTVGEPEEPDATRITHMAVAVANGRSKESFVKTENEAKVWDELVADTERIRASGYDVSIPNE